MRFAKVRVLFMCVAILGGFISIALAWHFGRSAGRLVVAWFVCPPAYFFLEYPFGFKRSLGESDDHFKMRRDEAKMYYDLARNIWAALAVALLATVKADLF